MKVSPNALTALAILTNPLVWLCVCLAVAFGVLYVMYLYIKAELSVPERRLRFTSPVVLEPTPDDWPLIEPTPPVVVRLDEFGRPEVLTEDSVTTDTSPKGPPSPTDASVLQPPTGQRGKTSGVSTARPKPKPRANKRKKCAAKKA